MAKIVLDIFQVIKVLFYSGHSLKKKIKKKIKGTELLNCPRMEAGNNEKERKRRRENK